MKSRELLITLAIKHKGNWDLIFESVKNKKFVSEEEGKELLRSIKSKTITIIDENYPEILKQTHKPPFVLFCLGDLSLLKDGRPKLAVVGSRENTQYGRNATEYLVKNVCKQYVIISGLARGIDAIAHETSLNNGGRTIAVLGCGTNVCFPQENFKLYKRIIETDLVISEYPDDVKPESINFPIRNRIVAGLCDGLLVTEAYERSGTMITTALVLDQGKQVCVVPYDIFSNSKCNYLISEGAYLVEKPEDILEALDYKNK